MFKLVAKVAINGELIDVMEAPVFEVKGLQMLAAACSDERALLTACLDADDGEVWIGMQDAHGAAVVAFSVGFHRVDAADALTLYFGAAPGTVTQCLSRSNVAAHYRERQAARRGPVTDGNSERVLERRSRD
ncbi:hypothetical protein CJO80_27220 (plasmid) [Ralstonia solanacearum]|nr:hypothetical protein CJO80_27220 [Ralstonia solanacearum]